MQRAVNFEKKNSRRIWIKYHPIYFSVRCLPRLNIAVFCQNKTKNIVTTKFDGRPLAPTLARGMVQKSKLYYLHGRIMVHVGSNIFLKLLFYLYLKFISFEKTTKIWRNVLVDLFLIYYSTNQLGDFVVLLWPSQNIWTLPTLSGDISNPIFFFVYKISLKCSV